MRSSPDHIVTTSTGCASAPFALMMTFPQVALGLPVNYAVKQVRSTLRA